jgi:hypothetical protein
MGISIDRNFGQQGFGEQDLVDRASTEAVESEALPAPE